MENQGILNLLGGLFIASVLMCSLCVFCYMKKRRRPQQRRSHSMVYSVTMQGGNGASFYNSVTEYLRYSQTNQDNLEVTASQRQRNGNYINERKLTPKGLPSYDDVISGKFDGSIDLPPPYSEAANCNLDATNSPS